VTQQEIRNELGVFICRFISLFKIDINSEQDVDVLLDNIDKWMNKRGYVLE